MAFLKEVKKVKDGLTVGDLLDRFALLSEVKGLPNALCSARSKNLMILRKFEKENSATVRIPLTEEFETYQKAFNETRGKYLLTDSEGKSVLIGGNPAIDVANPKLVKELADLKAKYAEAIKERDADIKAYTEFMDEIVTETFDFKNIKDSDTKELTQHQYDAVAWMIKE